MACELVGRLRAVMDELRSEGNLELAARVEQAIADLERASAPLRRTSSKSSSAAVGP